MREPTISAGFVRGLLEFIVSRGASRAELLRLSAIDGDDLENQDNRIPFAKYMSLMSAGKELARDPALALHFGEAFDMADLSIIGLIARASETFVEALVQINRFQRLGADLNGVDAADGFAILRDGTQVWAVDARKIPSDFPEITEAFFARIVCGIRRIVNAPVAQAIHFVHRAPLYVEEYARIFRAPVVFESDKNAVLIDDFWLTFKNPLSSRYTFGVLSERAETLLRELEASDTTRARVESFLMPILHTGCANMRKVADKVGVSSKTLSRRLRAEGVTFEQVLDELRHRLALDYLSGKKATVHETAYLVGFSDPATFSRAFKRWTGTSPGSMRTAGSGAKGRRRR